jgi:post-segregation antitoxin (ccd killing protein)
MAKRITISVPDDLHEKMTEWRSALNFSKVFQNAVANMIRKKEALRNRISEEMDFSSIVDRLKREKIEFESNIVENGKKDGLEWSKTAHYRELQYALSWVPDENPASDEELGAYFTQIFTRYRKRLALTGRMAQQMFGDFAKKYVDGWKEGVELFWNEVKDKL